MKYLVISILASVGASVFLKIARQKKIAIDQAVAINYLMAILLILIFFRPKLENSQLYLSQWKLLTALGILLPSIFLIMGKTIQTVGIVKADAAQRLSLFIAIIAAFTVFGDTLTLIKGIGITLALLALTLLMIKPHTQKYPNGGFWIIGVWLGFGVIDILFKQMAKTGIAFTSYLLICFIIAAIFMFAYLLLRGTRFTLSSIIGGIILGALNFTNIYTYIRAHQILHYQTALVFTTMNIGVILFATLIGVIFFHEKLNKTNLLGLILAIIAIVVLFDGNRLLTSIK